MNIWNLPCPALSIKPSQAVCTALTYLFSCNSRSLIEICWIKWTFIFYISMWILCIYASGKTMSQWDCHGNELLCSIWFIEKNLCNVYLKTPVNSAPNFTSTFPIPSGFASAPGPPHPSGPSPEITTILGFIFIIEILCQGQTLHKQWGFTTSK